MAATALHNLTEQQYKQRIRAWTLYDWANSAFATTILAAVLPVYYSSVAGANLSSAAKATQYWSATLSISVFIVALMSPILGTVSDIMRGKKLFLSLFVGIGVIGTGLLFFVDTGDWLLASAFFVIGRIGFGAANVFYDALLPHVAKEEDQDRISALGYALGYLGGGILLAINIVMIQTLEGTLGARLSFLSVAVWWAIFSIPILLRVPEPEAGGEKLKEGESLWTIGFKRIAHTIRNIRQFNELFKYLVAFLIYNDGIGVIITVAAIYVAELGFGSIETILAILLVQFVGIPYSLVFGNLPSKSNKRQTMYAAFVIFNIITLPLIGIGGRFLLPQTLTGNPSADFVTVGNFVGQGEHEAGAFTVGAWQDETVSGDLRGEGCAWYAIGCDESQFDATYVVATDPSAQIDFPFNGQDVAVVYSTGPDNGVWAVSIDGEPLVDADGEAVVIDATGETERYDVSAEFSAADEGEHTLTLTNQDGKTMSVRGFNVLPPNRTSNLGSILGILVAAQLIGVVFAWLAGPRFFQGIADKFDTKRSIFLALIAYAVIAIWGFFLDSVIEFWFLAWMVAVVQGGSQALSRSLYAAMTPKAMSGEFFGFFSIMSKFASFLSPLIFVASVAIFDSSRPGILSLIALFLIGIFLLSRVDVEEGKRVARETDARLAAAN